MSGAESVPVFEAVDPYRMVAADGIERGAVVVGDVVTRADVLAACTLPEDAPDPKHWRVNRVLRGSVGATTEGNGLLGADAGVDTTDHRLVAFRIEGPGTEARVARTLAASTSTRRIDEMYL